MKCENINSQSDRVRRRHLHEDNAIDSSAVASGVKSLSRFEGELSFSSTIIRAIRMHVIPRVYLRLPVPAAPFSNEKSQACTANSLRAPSLSATRLAHSGARMEPRNVSDTRPEITHARAEFTRRGCDKNSSSKSRSDCAAVPSRTPNIRLEYSARDALLPRREKGSFAETFRARIELSRFAAPAILFVLFDLPGSPLRRKFELGNSSPGAAVGAMNHLTRYVVPA